MQNASLHLNSMFLVPASSTHLALNFCMLIPNRAGHQQLVEIDGVRVEDLSDAQVAQLLLGPDSTKACTLLFIGTPFR
jgi:hypothetical protein